MKINHVHAVYFSPTGNAKKVVHHAGAGHRGHTRRPDGFL